MNYIFILLIILAILAVFIFIQRMSQKEKLKRAQELKAKRMLARIEEIWELVDKTATLMDAPDVMDTLFTYYLHQVRQRDQLTDHNDSTNLISRVDELKSRLGAIKIASQLNSDAEINHSKKVFAQVSKILRSAHNIKLINGQACNVMRTHLRRRILDLEVDAHERMGDAAGERGDPAIATNHYKYAKKLLIESDLKFEGKNEKVRELTHKTQVLFGNAVADKLSKGVDAESSETDEFGLPKDLDVMAGNKKLF